MTYIRSRLVLFLRSEKSNFVMLLSIAQKLSTFDRPIKSPEFISFILLCDRILEQKKSLINKSINN